MTTDTIAQRVIRCIADQLGSFAPLQINPADSLESDLGCDSLDLVELTMQLEDAFDIRIDDDRFIQFTTVQQVIDHVHELTGVPA